MRRTPLYLPVSYKLYITNASERVRQLYTVRQYRACYGSCHTSRTLLIRVRKRRAHAQKSLLLCL